MSTFLNWITCAYKSLLRLYPPAFRQQLGEEMQTVFEQVAADAERSGWFSLFLVCWRELRDLPVSLVEAHRSHPHGGFHMKTMDYSRWFGDPQSPPDTMTPRPWREVLMGVVFFILFILALSSDIFYMKTENYQLIANIISLVILGLFLLLLVWGAIRKFPDWSLPYTGLIISLLITYVLLLVFPNQPTLIMGVVFFLTPALIVLVSRWIKPLWSLWINIWEDPTRLGFLYFGLMALVCAFVMDDLPNQVLLISSSVALMIPVGILYMRSSRLWQRVLVLPAGYLAVWTFCIFFNLDLFHQPLSVSWYHGLDQLVRVGLLILAWFLLPGLWILLRRANWISPVEA